MIAKLRLIKVVIVTHKLRRIRLHLSDHTARHLIGAAPVISRSLRAQRLPQRFPFSSDRFRGLRFIKIPVRYHPAHVVHRGGHGCLDARIHSGRVDSKASPAADANNANRFRIHIRAVRQIINRSREVFRIEIGGSHIPGLPAGFTGE